MWHKLGHTIRYQWNNQKEFAIICPINSINLWKSKDVYTLQSVHYFKWLKWHQDHYEHVDVTQQHVHSGLGDLYIHWCLTLEGMYNNNVAG